MTQKFGSMRAGGVARATTAFSVAGRKAHKALVRVVREKVEQIATESLVEVPRVTGRLANSQRTSVVETPAVIGVVDFTASYAWPVHEVPRPAGSTGKSKYLEDPWKRAAATFVSDTAQRVAEALA